jgi:HAD superfamily hydrolase (TIGR01509 family)
MSMERNKQEPSMDSYSFAVLLDLDGTLVDSVFHHVLAWSGALQAGGHNVPLWRIHAGIGMGSQRLVPWLLGGHVPEASELSDDHERRFLEHADDLRATLGARELVEDLHIRKVPFVVATSATSRVREALLAALDCGDLETTDADDVSSPKPAPDLLLQACATLDVHPTAAILIGDSTWDVDAAQRIGMRTLAVRCGGFGEDALRRAGALDVVDDPRALIGRL